MESILEEAGIPLIDWFRLAQRKGGKNGWNSIVNRAFPRVKIHKYDRKDYGKTINEWMPGQPLPKPPAKRRRVTREVWIPSGGHLGEVGEGEPAQNPDPVPGDEFMCPVCLAPLKHGNQLRFHYETAHAVHDLAITTNSE